MNKPKTPEEIELDDEIDALARAVEAIGSQPPEAQRRILAYLQERFRGE